MVGNGPFRDGKWGKIGTPVRRKARHKLTKGNKPKVSEDQH